MVRVTHEVVADEGLAELQEGKAKTATAKRKSMFRSPGTASSPDLVTLVRKAKEAKEAKSANGPSVLAKPPSVPPPVPANGITQSYSTLSHASSSSKGTHKDRVTSHSQVPPSEDSWDRFSNGDMRSMPSGEKMATIAEGSGRRSRQSSGEEGFKVR